MSDTPKTDEALSYNQGYPNYLLEQVEKVSRQLELDIADLERQLAEKDKEIERMRAVKDWAEHWSEYTHKYVTVRERGYLDAALEVRNMLAKPDGGAET